MNRPRAQLAATRTLVDMNREQHAQDDAQAILPAASGRRLSNQIGRAFRGTFGAKTGLRTIIRSVAAEMLAAGATKESVARALETCVLDHPARADCDSHSLVSGTLHSTVLVELASECVADVARSDGETVNSAREPALAGAPCVERRGGLPSSLNPTRRPAPSSACSSNATATPSSPPAPRMTRLP